MRALEQVARRCLPICHINPSIKVHVEHLTVNYRSDGTATKHAFKVTVQDKQYHFSVKKDAGNGHDISTQIAAMDCVRRSVSQCVRPESFTLRDGPHFAMLQAY
jgi:hypothetical protein